MVVDAETPIVRPGGRVAFRVRGAGARRGAVLHASCAPTSRRRGPCARIAGRGRPGRATTWDGNDDARRARRRPGTYLIAVTAYDKARNEGQGPRAAAARPAARRRGPPGRHRPHAGRAAAGARRARRATSSTSASTPAAARSAGRCAGSASASRSCPAAATPGKTRLLIRVPRGPSGVFLLRAESHGSDTTVPDRRARPHEFFENAPIDDEPTAPEEERSAAEAWEQRHDSVSIGELSASRSTAGWRIEFTPPARRDLGRSDRASWRPARARPRPAGRTTRQAPGLNEHRLRVGDWRVRVRLAPDEPTLRAPRPAAPIATDGWHSTTRACPLRAQRTRHAARAARQAHAVEPNAPCATACLPFTR